MQSGAREMNSRFWGIHFPCPAEADLARDIGTMRYPFPYPAQKVTSLDTWIDCSRIFQMRCEARNWIPDFLGDPTYTTYTVGSYDLNNNYDIYSFLARLRVSRL